MKTWEIYQKIDENPKEMLGKKFRQVGGMVRDCFWIGDIAEITQYHTLIGFGNLKYEKIRITDLNGFEEWELVQEPVTWQEAMQAWALEQKKVYYEMDGHKYELDRWNARFHPAAIVRGKWYIEDGEPNGY